MPPSRLIINSRSVLNLNQGLDDRDAEVSRKELMIIWNQLEQDEAAAFFRRPGDMTVTPKYSKGPKARESMDLYTIGQKIKRGFYKKLTEFMDDCHSMFEHVYHYYSNRSAVYKHAWSLEHVFEKAVQPLIDRYGYCCSKKMYYTPVSFSCYKKKDCMIPPGKYFYCHQLTSGDITEYYFLCVNCYNKLPIEGLDVSQNNGNEPMLIPKRDFVRGYNPLQNPERFVFCSYCQKRFHEVCVRHCSTASSDFVCVNCSQIFGQIPDEFNPLGNFIILTCRKIPFQSFHNIILRISFN